MNCQAQTLSPRDRRPVTTDEENWPQYRVPSPDLINTVSIPRACALAAMVFRLPCEERLRYQIHMPSPASGFFGFEVSPVWELAPPVSGPAAKTTAKADESSAIRFLRRRERMDRGYEGMNTPPQGKVRRVYAVDAAGSCSSAWYELRTSGPEATDSKPS